VVVVGNTRLLSNRTNYTLYLSVSDPKMSHDPFDCFGEDSESESEFGDDIAEQDLEDEKRRRSLMGKANERLFAASSTADADRIVSASSTDETQSSPSEILVDLPPPVTVPFPPALFIGPIRVVQSNDIGGNRGYIATQDLEPGTLLLVEQPIFEWTEDQIGSELGLVSVQAILRHENACAIVKDMQGLYPTKEQVDDFVRNKKAVSKDEQIQILDMMDVMDMQHSGKEMNFTLDLARQYGIDLDEIDVCRMLLAMRYNGFGSGIYLHFAMFNHDVNGNSIKFQPEINNAESKQKQGSKGYGCYSEVRTTKFVKRGESLTLDYLIPREQSYAMKRRHLWDQHRFDIGSLNSLPDLNLREMYLVNGQCPPSSRDNVDRDADTYHVESALKELEEQHNEIKITWSLLARLKDEGEDALKLFEHSKAMGEATFELLTATQNKLINPNHILLIQCCRLYLDCAEIALEMGVRFASHFSSTSFGPIGGNLIMANFVTTCHKLLSLQIKYLGNEHPDVARSYHDLAGMINAMITQCPDSLYGCGIEEYSVFGKCQRIEAKYSSEFRRIDALYPKDVENKIEEYRSSI